MTGGPVLELLVHPGTGGRIAPLVRQLARWCDPRAPDRTLTRPAARLASSWRAPFLDAAARAGEDIPLALWINGQADIDAAGGLLEHCRVVVTDNPTTAEHLDAAVLVVHPRIDPHDYRPITPYVRSRWRSRLGFPADMVVDVRSGIDGLLDDAVVPTALALAGAAVVDRHWIDVALALGAPVITDAETAQHCGASAGIEVEVTDPDDALSAAWSLAEDVARSAALGRAGRRHCERRHDHRSAAALVATWLGLTRGVNDAHHLMRQRLGELWTPADARISMRASAAVRGLAPLASPVGSQP